MRCRIEGRIRLPEARIRLASAGAVVCRTHGGVTQVVGCLAPLGHLDADLRSPPRWRRVGRQTLPTLFTHPRSKTPGLKQIGI